MTKGIIHIEFFHGAKYKVFYANKKQKQNLICYCNIGMREERIKNYKVIPGLHECYDFLKRLDI